jgi:RNA polymerase sigma-70 factor (ECF subfamily)
VADHRSFDWEMALERAYRVAFAILRDAARAKDVAQQACFKALVKLDSFQGRCSFPSWVRSIALHVAFDEKRGLGRLDGDPDELPGNEDPEHRAASQQSSEALLRCLAELTERQRLIFLAKHLDQMKGAEIAAEMNTKPGTVWATLHQATANLRLCLNRHGIDRGVLH